MKRYRCIKEYIFNKCDEDGSMMDGEYGTVQIGSIWQESDDMICGGKDNVHLDRLDSSPVFLEWCEPLKETLAEYFEEIERSKK